MPRIEGLAGRLEALAGEIGCAGQMRIMQSNGGLMSVAAARTHPVRTLLSGPAGGVVGAVGVAGAAGLDDVIAMDMGGTSLDICLVRGAEITLSSEGRVGAYPVQVPQVDVHTIGAGGGSIARVIPGRPEGRPGERGRGPGPGVLRQGRGAADQHRRRRHPRLHRPGVLRGRRDAPGRGRGAPCHRSACRPSAGDGCGRGGARHRPGPGGRNGHRDPRGLGGAGLGSARLRAAALRRGGLAVGGAGRRGFSASIASSCPSSPGCCRRSACCCPT